MTQPTPGPLAGIRIIEMEAIGPVPFCGMLFADMGADVVKIDGPRTRIAGGPYDVTGRGKRSISLDLKSDADRAIALDLIAKADGLIEGYRPGVMERLGLGPDVALARNAKLVFGRMTGWGQHGPLAHAAGHDLNYLALTGALHAMGEAGKPPMPPLNLVGDYGGGAMYLAMGMLAAILATRNGAPGQVIDVAMTDGAASLTAMFAGLQAMGIWTQQRQANLLDGGAHFYGCYETADGKYVSIGAIEPQFYALLRQKAGLSDPQWDAQMDKSQWPRLRADLAAIIKGKTRDEWCTLMEGSDVCFAPVLDWQEARAHPHNLARATFIERDGVPQPAPAPRFSGHQPHVPGPAPTPGQHRQAILADWLS